MSFPKTHHFPSFVLNPQTTYHNTHPHIYARKTSHTLGETSPALPLLIDKSSEENFGYQGRKTLPS